MADYLARLRKAIEGADEVIVWHHGEPHRDTDIRDEALELLTALEAAWEALEFREQDFPRLDGERVHEYHARLYDVRRSKIRRALAARDRLTGGSAEDEAMEEAPSQPARISPLRLSWILLWAAITHPFTAIEIDPTTGEVTPHTTGGKK